MNRYINPLNEGFHPLRRVMTTDEWDALDRWVGGDDSVVPDMEQIDAYRCWLFDELSARVKTHAMTLDLH